MIYCDNQSCVKLSKNSLFHERLKHIEIKYYISNDEKIADIFGKAYVQDEKFVCLKDKLRLVEMTFLLEKEVITPRVGREHLYVIDI
jgi:hypothetical protein